MDIPLQSIRPSSTLISQQKMSGTTLDLEESKSKLVEEMVRAKGK